MYMKKTYWWSTVRNLLTYECWKNANFVDKCIFFRTIILHRKFLNYIICLKQRTWTTVILCPWYSDLCIFTTKLNYSITVGFGHLGCSQWRIRNTVLYACCHIYIYVIINGMSVSTYNNYVLCTNVWIRQSCHIHVTVFISIYHSFMLRANIFEINIPIQYLKSPCFSLSFCSVNISMEYLKSLFFIIIRIWIIFCHEKFMNRIFHINILQFICWGLYVMMKVLNELMTSPCFCSSSFLNFYVMTNLWFWKQHVSVCHSVEIYIINVLIG